MHVQVGTNKYITHGYAAMNNACMYICVHV